MPFLSRKLFLPGVIRESALKIVLPDGIEEADELVSGQLAWSAASQIDGFDVFTVAQCLRDGAQFHLSAECVHVSISHFERCGAVKAAVDAAAFAEGDMYV